MKINIGWHTACIISELQEEMKIEYSHEFQELYYLRTLTRRFIQAIQECDDMNEETLCEFNMILHLENELQLINSEISSLFNENFGSIFRTDGHPSIYAFAIRRYCDLYMTQITDLLNYKMHHRFYPQQGIHMVSFHR